MMAAGEKKKETKSKFELIYSKLGDLYIIEELAFDPMPASIYSSARKIPHEQRQY